MFISRGRRPIAVVLVVFALVIAAVDGLAAADHRLTSARMPQTLKADAGLLPQIEHLIAMSPTFREQCLRLDEAEKLVVLLRLNPLLPTGLFRARSMMRRYSSGLLIATVEVAPGSDQAEWIAHEFEHVLEMLEGQQLPNLARRLASGVWQSTTGMYETRRATEAGRNVRAETQLVDTSDKFVE
ncbi:MAG TPA: hypothetical protein VM032_02785 [Vicinamibacterales bacterium]|nr:hypothetical protein [Vicinamibacterales bacterium]